MTDRNERTTDGTYQTRYNALVDDFLKFTDDPGAPVVKDFDELLSDYVAGDALTGAAGHFGFRAWTVGAHQLVDAGTRLDGELDFTFAGPDDLRIVAYDRAHPLTWCPPDDFTVTAANATFRTPDGCLVWAAGTRVLRIELRTTRTEPATSLLPLWRKR